MKLTAVKVLEVKKEKQINDTFKVRNLWVETSDQYPQSLSIEFTQDKCQLLDSCNEGDILDIHINLKGRKWTDSKGEEQLFTSIRGWRIDKVSSQQKIEYPEPVDQVPERPEYPVEGDDDLPF